MIGPQRLRQRGHRALANAGVRKGAGRRGAAACFSAFPARRQEWTNLAATRTPATLARARIALDAGPRHVTGSVHGIERRPVRNAVIVAAMVRSAATPSAAMALPPACYLRYKARTVGAAVD